MNKKKNQENLCFVREKKDVISLLTFEWMHIAAQAKKVTCKCSAGSEKSSSVKKKTRVWVLPALQNRDGAVCVVQGFYRH